MDSVDKIAIPVLLVQGISVVFMATLDTVSLASQQVYILFLSADLMGFGLFAHVWVSTRTGIPPRPTTLMLWGLFIFLLFLAGLVVS